MEHDISQPGLDAAWLGRLRQRFTEIAGRRVPADAVEDLVHDALSIILAKGPAQARSEGRAEPSLRWSFVVLRNVIGNWYQKRRHHESVADHDLRDERPDQLAALTSAERVEAIRGAVEELRSQRPDCAGWLWKLAQGVKAAELFAHAGLASAVFYRKVYRCRKLLAEILQRQGVTP